MNYLIWSNEHNAWWGDDYSGYVQKVENAGRYCFVDALRICNEANFNWDTDKTQMTPNELPIAEEIATDLIYNRYKKRQTL